MLRIYLADLQQNIQVYLYALDIEIGNYKRFYKLNQDLAKTARLKQPQQVIMPLIGLRYKQRALKDKRLFMALCYN